MSFIEMAESSITVRQRTYSGSRWEVDVMSLDVAASSAAEAVRTVTAALRSAGETDERGES